MSVNLKYIFILIIILNVFLYSDIKKQKAKGRLIVFVNILVISILLFKGGAI